MTLNINNKLVISFHFKLQHKSKQHPSNTVETSSSDTSNDTPNTFRRSTVYRRTLKMKDSEKGKKLKENDRKRWNLR